MWDRYALQLCAWKREFCPLLWNSRFSSVLSITLSPVYQQNTDTIWMKSIFSFNVLLSNQEIMVFLSGSQWGLHNRGKLGFKGDRKAGRGTIPTKKSRSDQIARWVRNAKAGSRWIQEVKSSRQGYSAQTQYAYFVAQQGLEPELRYNYDITRVHGWQSPVRLVRVILVNSGP